MLEDSLAKLVIWASAEEWLVLIAINVPHVWPLFKPHAQQAVATFKRMPSMEAERTHGMLLQHRAPQHAKAVNVGFASSPEKHLTESLAAWNRERRAHVKDSAQYFV